MSARQGARCAECGRERRIHSRGLCSGCYRRWYRASSPERAEKERAAARAWKVAHREENRQRDRERSRLPEQRGICETCGGLLGVNSRDRYKQCRACFVRAAHERRVRLVEMWAGGAKLSEIRAEFGWSEGHLSAEMSRARKMGYDLPYRRTAEQRARMRVGQSARRVGG